MSMTRTLLVAGCALLSLSVWAQAQRARAKPPPGGGGGCPVQPAECQVSSPVFNFGRATMGQNAPPIYGHHTISVTCTRAPVERMEVDVRYVLKAEPAEPARQMRDRELGFLRYDLFIDPARTQYWGDGYYAGTFAFEGALFLDDRNRVGSLFHVVYGRVDGGQSLVRPNPHLGAVVTRLEYQADCRR